MIKHGIENDNNLYKKDYYLMTECKFSLYRYKDELYKELIELSEI